MLVMLIFLDISEPSYVGLRVNDNIIRVTNNESGYEPESLNIRRVTSYNMGIVSKRGFYIDTIRKLIYAFYGGGLVIYNVSNPNSPYEVYKNTNTPYYISIINCYDYNRKILFTTDVWFGTIIWSVDDINNPYVIGISDTFLGSRCEVINNNLFVVRGSSFIVYDISNLPNITKISSIGLNGNAIDLVIRGDYAYIPVVLSSLGNLTTLYIYDIMNLNYISSIDLGFYCVSNQILVGNNLYYACRQTPSIVEPTNKIVKVDISDSSNISKTIVYTHDSSILFISAYNSTFYLTDENGNVFSIDMNNWQVKDTYQASWDINGLASTFVINIKALNENFLLVIHGIQTQTILYGEYSTALGIIDFNQNPINLNILGDYYGSTMDVIVNYPYAYLLDYAYGIRVLNISNLYNIQEIGNYKYPGACCRLFREGNYLFMPVADSGVIILDISNPSQITQVGKFSRLEDDDYCALSSAYIVNDIGYFAGRGCKYTYSVNLQDKTNPVLIDTANMLNNPAQISEIFALSYSNNYLYGSDVEAGIFDILSASNTGNISYVSTVNENFLYLSFNFDIIAKDTIVYLSYNLINWDTEEWIFGVGIYNVKDPLNVNLISFYRVPFGGCGGIFLKENHIYFGCADGFRLIDISNLQDPVLVGYYLNATSVVQFDVSNYNDYIYGACGDQGLCIFDLDITSNKENEIRPHVVFKAPNYLIFNTSKAGNLNIELYDVRGSKVLDRSYYVNSGYNRIKLDDLRSGIYFYKLRIDSRVFKGKFIYVK